MADRLVYVCRAKAPAFAFAEAVVKEELGMVEASLVKECLRSMGILGDRR